MYVGNGGTQRKDVRRGSPELAWGRGRPGPTPQGQGGRAGTFTLQWEETSGHKPRWARTIACLKIKLSWTLESLSYVGEGEEFNVVALVSMEMPIAWPL